MSGPQLPLWLFFPTTSKAPACFLFEVIHYFFGLNVGSHDTMNVSASDMGSM